MNKYLYSEWRQLWTILLLPDIDQQHIVKYIPIINIIIIFLIIHLQTSTSLLSFPLLIQFIPTELITIITIIIIIIITIKPNSVPRL